MNMFKSRRRAKEHFDAPEAFDGPHATPMSQRAMKNLKRKNKKSSEESKPTFDLSTALPDDKDFRTSLLMPNLSARFSMLREQDDPNSKLGKASDDSVLFPKRTSRFNLFDQNMLADVAEDEPALSTFRPPFADRDRSNSLGDGYDSDGSIMNRSRPNEGNNLFGGRQKVYRIPNTSNRNVNDDGTVMAGRHVYEPDVSLSQFQLFKLKEKEALKQTDDHSSGAPATDGADGGEIASPATTFSKNRETQSSTNSIQRRTSTAATSIASESPIFRNSAADSVTTKNNDTTTAPEHLPSISVPKLREDPSPGRFAIQTRSPTSDKYPKPVRNFSTSLRNASSPPGIPKPQPLDFGFKTESRSNSATGRYQTESPTPFQLPGSEDVLASNLQPSDRGKATALGLFNKPAREFNEHQFNQRQLQMHEDQVSSMSNGSRSASQASNDAQRIKQGSVPAPNSQTVSSERSSTPQISYIPNPPIQSGNDSNRLSKTSERGIALRQRSKSTTSSTGDSVVRSRVESLIRKNNAELTALEAEKLGSMENKENCLGTFFAGGEDDEETDSDEYCRFDSSRASSHKIDESDIHPAFRNSHMIPDTQSRKSNYSYVSRTKSFLEEERSESSRLRVPSIDTDHVGQSSVAGLSGLIRSHLRRDSDKSSFMLRPESSIAPATTEPSRRGSLDSTNKTTADSLRSDPFDPEQNKGLQTHRTSQNVLTPTTAISQVAQQFLTQARALSDATEHRRETVLTENAVDAVSSPNEKSWHESLEPKKHQRGESSETTKERREFDAELAERRKKIREGLKSVTERDRSQSPANTNRGQAITMQAFVQQRAMTETSPKTTTKPGQNNHTMLNAPNDEERGRASTHKLDLHGPPAVDGFRNAKQAGTHARFTPEANSDRSQVYHAATPPAARYGMRQRSHSNTGDRQTNRNRHRDVKPSVPYPRGYLADLNQSSPSPTEEPHNNSDPNIGTNVGYRGARTSPDVITGSKVRPLANSSPVSPQSQYDPIHEAVKSPVFYSNGRTTPNNGRSAPGAFNRKRSVTKTMISEPTFVSSTSSVPLVRLPDAQQDPANSTPALPLMNPRRRGNTAGERPALSPIGIAMPRSTPLEPVPASPIVSDFGTESHGQRTNSPSPRKLRKANSEGGSMAARARQQAMAVELAHEKIRSPILPVFPNRSATTLPITTDGAMF